MAKKNYKQPILQWLATGNHARRTVDNALTAFRVDVPELKKCPDGTFCDYYKRYNDKGMRAAEPRQPTPDAKLIIKTSSKKTKK